jgi:hypothetical protein
MTITRRILTTALLLAAGAGPALAGKPAPAGCVEVTVERIGSLGNTLAGGELINHCDRDLNIQYCVQNAGSKYSCESTGGGMVSVEAKGRVLNIPGYHQAPGKVIFGACFSPDFPANWHSTGDGHYSFDCQ